MAIVLTGTGGLFTRCGRLLGLLNNVIGHAGANDPSVASRWGSAAQTIHNLDDGINNIEAQFASTLQNLIDGLYGARDSHRDALSGLKSYLKGLAETTIIEMADSDVKLTSKTLTLALAELITQMGTVDSVKKPTVSATVASISVTSSSVANPTVITTGTAHGFVTGNTVVIDGHSGSTPNINGEHVATVVSATTFTIPVNVTVGGTGGTVRKGNVALIASVIGPTGVQRDYVFDEVIDVICTTDSQQGGTLGAEGFTASGDNAIGDTLAFNWPKGSGSSTSLTAVDANTTSANLLTNSDFGTFTVANTPDSWTLDGAVAGTDLFAAGSADAYTNSNALKYTGMTATKGIYQALTTLKPNTVYAVNCWLKRSSGLAAGVLQLDLHDGTSVINDDQAVANSAAVTLAANTSVAYVPLSIITLTGTRFFRTPRILPATIRFRVMVTTGLTAAESVFVDRLAFVEASELYTRGPYTAIFSGKTKSIINDKYTLTVANDAMTGLGNGSHFQRGFERFFGMRDLNLQLPSSGSPTISDNEIINQ